LQFGISSEDAKLKLGSQFGFKPGTVKGDYTLEPDYELEVGVLTLQLTPSLAFGSLNHLSVVNLDLDVPKVLANNGGRRVTLDTRLLASLAARDIYSALLAKYGKPLTTEGHCEDSSDALLPGGDSFVFCNASWRGDSQLVSMVWSYNTRQKALSVLISYKAQNNGL
jgi:hypothetical protein